VEATLKPERSNNNNPNILRKLFLFGLGSFAIVLGGFFAIVYWWYPGFTQSVSEANNWNLLEGFTSAISLALLAGGITFAFAEYVDKENAKQDEKNKLSYEIYKAIFDKLTDPEQEAARRWILSNINIKRDEEDIEHWYKQTQAKIMKKGKGDKDGLPEGQRAVKMTLNCFDYIGFIAVHYWEIEDDSLDWISSPIAKVWRRLDPYVGHVRTLRKTNEYYTSAEYVGDLCVNWRQRKGLPDEEYTKGTP